MLATASRRAGMIVLVVASLAFAQDSGPVLAPPAAAAASPSAEIPLWGPSNPQPAPRDASRASRTTATPGVLRLFRPRPITAPRAGVTGIRPVPAPMLEPPRSEGPGIGASNPRSQPAPSADPVERAPLPSEDLEPPPLLPPSDLPPGGLPLEIVPDESAPTLDPAIQPLPDPGPSRGDCALNDRDDEAEEDPDEHTPPRRRGLGALLRPRSSQQPDRERPRNPVDEDSNAAADTALERRLERQIRESSGRHLKSLDVSVRGNAVRIRARADRFWNRRGLRRAITGLPTLAGYDTDITVD